MGTGLRCIAHVEMPEPDPFPTQRSSGHFCTALPSEPPLEGVLCLVLVVHSTVEPNFAFYGEGHLPSSVGLLLDLRGGDWWCVGDMCFAYGCWESVCVFDAVGTGSRFGRRFWSLPVGCLQWFDRGQRGGRGVGNGKERAV